MNRRIQRSAFVWNKKLCNIIHYTFQSQYNEGGGIESNTFILQGCIKLIKSDDKDIYNVTKDFYFR